MMHVLAQLSWQGEAANPQSSMSYRADQNGTSKSFVVLNTCILKCIAWWDPVNILSKGEIISPTVTAYACGKAWNSYKTASTAIMKQSVGNLPVLGTAGFPDGKQSLKPALLDDLELKLWKLLPPVIAVLGWLFLPCRWYWMAVF